jgi:anti-sigma B factor antagonist
MPLYMVEKLVGGVILLDLRGRIILGPETTALREKVNQLVAAGYTKIVLNLEEVSYVDSVGLSTLVASYTSARKQGGDMKLLHLTSRVRDLLQITHLTMVFDTYDNFEEAARSFRDQASEEVRT